MRTLPQTSPSWLGACRPPAAAWRLAVLLTIGLGSVGQAAVAEPAPPGTLHIACSSAMFTEINENDARASVKVWAQTIAEERGVAAALKMHTTTSGRQLTTIFQCDRLEICPPADLENARALLAEHTRRLAAFRHHATATTPDANSLAGQ